MTDQITFKDKIYNFIEKHGRIISSKALVKTFLKADYDDEVIATKIISSIIGNDQRFEYIEYVGWRVSGSRLESIPISKQKFVIFATNIAKTGSWKGRICEASFTKIINAREDTSLHIGFSPYDSGKQFEIKSGNNSQIQEKKYLGIKIKDAYNILKFIEDSIILFFEPLST